MLRPSAVVDRDGPRAGAVVELELHFDDLEEDVVDAVVDVLVHDLAVADGRSDPLPAAPGAVAVSPGSPSARVAVPSPRNGDEPALLVRVRGFTIDDRPVQFLNTTATRLPAQPRGPVRVHLQRV